ncbi:hypothetical protein MVEG_08023 [Podila verticillata NRRL 6337]|nr:hypothetical protein MVEG_08023 [Podila verticillata NRRL 6337]
MLANKSFSIFVIVAAFLLLATVQAVPTTNAAEAAGTFILNPLLVSRVQHGLIAHADALLVTGNFFGYSV